MKAKFIVTVAKLVGSIVASVATEKVIKKVGGKLIQTKHHPSY